MCASQAERPQWGNSPAHTWISDFPLQDWDTVNVHGLTGLWIHGICHVAYAETLGDEPSQEEGTQRCQKTRHRNEASQTLLVRRHRWKMVNSTKAADTWTCTGGATGSPTQRVGHEPRNSPWTLTMELLQEPPASHL